MEIACVDRFFGVLREYEAIQNSVVQKQREYFEEVHVVDNSIPHLLAGAIAQLLANDEEYRFL